MATLVKTGIGDGQTLTPVIITELYDAFTGDKLFDNIIINNSMKVTHDGKVAIGKPGSPKNTPYALNVEGDIQATVGRFNQIIVVTQSIVTSSVEIITGSTFHGTLGTNTHIFTGSLQVSSSGNNDSYFLNNLAIGKTENVRNIFEVQGSTTVSHAITASDLTITQTGSFAHLSVSGDAIIEGNLTFGNAPTDNISFAADIDSNFIPDDDFTFNIGSSIKRWNTIFGNTITGSLISGDNIFINNPNIIISSSLVSGSFRSTGSFGFINVHKNISVGNNITLGGNLSGSGDVNFEGTGSFGALTITDTITINTASIDQLNVSDIKLNNLTGSEGQVLKRDIDGNLTYDFTDRTTVIGKNVSGGSMSAGTPVYIFSYVGSDVYGVDKSRNDVEARTPAVGITQNSMALNQTGSIVLSGLVRSSELDTSGFSVGDTLFLGVDALQNTKPTGAGVEIQVMGSVLKSSATNGEILLLSGGGGGSLEVLNIDHIFVGSGSTTENLHLSGALNRATLDNVTATGTGSFGHLIVNGNITASGVIRADAFESVNGGEAIDFKDSINVTGNLTASGDLKIDDLIASGNVSGSVTSTGSMGRLESTTLSVNTPLTSSTAIFTNNIQNGYPIANRWQENLEGSFFNNFTPESHVSEILRFMAGVISHSIDTAAPTPNLKFWNNVSTSHTAGSTTSKGSLLNGVLGSSYENARLSAHWTGSSFIDMSETGSYRKVQDYLQLKGFVQSSDRGTFGNDTGTNPFHGSYASRIPSTIITNGTFDTNTFTITANAGGSSAIFSNSNFFGLGGLTNGGATPYTVKIAASSSFSDNYSDSTPDKNSTFHTASFIDYTISSFGTSNGLVLAKIETNQPAVIPAAFQDGDFNNVVGAISGRYYTGGSANENNISASGYYAIHDVRAGLKSGSMSNFQYKDGSDSTTRFYLYTGDLPTDITDGAPTPSISKDFIRTSFSATSRSLSGAPYLLTTTYGFTYSARATNCFDPCYGFNSTPLINSNPTDTWDSVGSTNLSNTSVSVTNSGVQSTGTSTYVISSDFSTKRTSNSIPHITDVSVASSSFTFSLDSNSTNVVSARSTQEDLNYSLTFRTTARNWKNSNTTSTTSATNLYTASLFGQPSSSGSMAIYSRAQGYDANTLADSTETFTGEDFRIVLADNVQAFNGAYFTTDSYKTNDNGDAVLGNFDLQVKPGFLVDPGGTRGYWFPTNFGSGTYKYYIRRFQKTSSGTKTSMTLNLGTSLVAWNSTSNGVSAVILFESSGNGSGNNVALGRARIYDPTATTSNVIETNISNDNHKNPFSTAIDLYGNTGGSVGGTTYTIPIRNADGMYLDNSDNQLYVLVRYKGDPTPITSITLGYS